ncbi:hypothetical protein LCGC14_1002560 [marine sediment metagenome]|uniref:Uncharacterized protein n=1 Tax=marine sediment metagenome TaxID=412755 RepID=A0A0F9R8S4_9ZZZZ|nr:hypothetical protein [Candidatus Aminicenantes bacterium]
MGWWKIKDETGHIDWEHKSKTHPNVVNAIPGDDDKEVSYLGDEVADIFDETLGKMDKVYKKNWGRCMKKEELVALLNFCSADRR